MKQFEEWWTEEIGCSDGLKNDIDSIKTIAMCAYNEANNNVADGIRWYLEAEEAWQYASIGERMLPGPLFKNYDIAYDEAHVEFICARKNLKALCGWEVETA